MASRVVRIQVAPSSHGHLPSPVLAVKPGQAYTISAYTRSDKPSAKMRMAMWTRPMDFRADPDAYSEEITLTHQWRRYEFHCFLEDLLDRQTSPWPSHFR